MPYIGIEGVLQTQQRLTDSFACTDHRLQDSNWYRAHDSANRALGIMSASIHDITNFITNLVA